MVKGIVLAGGTGSRLHPLTHAISKQLLPVYNKPMIYYPISVLFAAGIREILIITSTQEKELFQKLLGDGSRFGAHFEYATQQRPEGIAQSFLIAESFIGDSDVCLILGDNIFYGAGLGDLLKKSIQCHRGATLFGYRVNDPERYGVVQFDSSGLIESIEEKPKHPKSQIAITGLYLYSCDVCQKAKTLRPSSRGELEITDINNLYLHEKKADITILGRGFTWLDTGTFDSLIQASEFVQVIESRQGSLIASLEEIALHNKWVSPEDVMLVCEKYEKNDYGRLLKRAVLEYVDKKEKQHAGS